MKGTCVILCKHPTRNVIYISIYTPCNIKKIIINSMFIMVKPQHSDHLWDKKKDIVCLGGLIIKLKCKKYRKDEKKMSLYIFMMYNELVLNLRWLLNEVGMCVRSFLSNYGSDSPKVKSYLFYSHVYDNTSYLIIVRTIWLSYGEYDVHTDHSSTCLLNVYFVLCVVLPHCLKT